MRGGALTFPCYSVSTQPSLKQLNSPGGVSFLRCLRRFGTRFTASYRQMGTISNHWMDIISAGTMVSCPSKAVRGASRDETYVTWVIGPQAIPKE